MITSALLVSSLKIDTDTASFLMSPYDKYSPVTALTISGLACELTGIIGLRKMNIDQKGTFEQFLAHSNLEIMPLQK